MKSKCKSGKTSTVIKDVIKVINRHGFGFGDTVNVHKLGEHEFHLPSGKPLRLHASFQVPPFSAGLYRRGIDGFDADGITAAIMDDFQRCLAKIHRITRVYPDPKTGHFAYLKRLRGVFIYTFVENNL